MTDNTLSTVLKQYREEVAHASLTRQAYTAILKAIRELYLQPGHSFLEREIADLLAMSRTPVHEALIRLEAAGWGTVIPRRGFQVAPIQAQTITEIAQISATLEGLATALVTSKLTDQQLTQLETLITQQDAAMQAQDLRRYVQIDQQFHSQLVAPTPNHRLGILIGSYADQLYRARLYAIDDRTLPVQSLQEHRAIIAAIRSRNAQAAQELMVGHRHRGSQEMVQIIRHKETPTGK